MSTKKEDEINLERNQDILEIEYENFRTYRRNKLLKNTNVRIAWTPELVEEYIKCKNDPIYFIEKYIKVVTLDEGLVPIKLRSYQLEIINGLHNHRRNIICASRQSGKSTSFIAYLTWYVIFNDHVLVAVLANRAETARELLGRLQTSYMYIPHFLQQGIVEFNKSSLDLENGSRIIADATNSDSIRGYPINFLIIDEAAHIDGWEPFSASVLPTISSGKTSKLCLISTPFGLNHFWKTWTGALEGTNDYNHVLVTWDKVPGRDAAWLKTTMEDLNFDTEKFEQEFNCVEGKTNITIKNNTTGDIQEIKIEELDNLLRV